MREEQIVHVKRAHAAKMKNGFPLIEKDAVKNSQAFQKEGTLLTLIDEQDRMIGKGYYGKQNKGYGWVLTQRVDEEIDAAFFHRKIREAVGRRAHFFARSETTAFRLFNGEGDGIGGLTIDYFAEFLLITWYSEGIYTFREWVLDAIEAEVGFVGIYEKKRFAKKGSYIEDDDFVRGVRGDFPLLIKENGVTYAVDLNDGPMVGIFLDQREVRRAIRERYAEGQTVLNTFSYTGAFSIAAALGGAVKTTSVDLANRSHAKTVEQFEVNGWSYQPTILSSWTSSATLVTPGRRE